jgi:diguanylate cyclase (GGDEF)-like protein
MVQGPADKLGASTDREAGEWVIRLCRAVRETLGADRVIVWLYDAPAQTVSPYATDSPEDEELANALERWDRTPLDSFPAACEVLLQGRPVEILDAQNDERVPAELAADLLLESVRFEPILAGRPIGMLSVEPAMAAASPELQSLLPLVAGGVGRVASLHESDRQRKQAQFLLELTEAANGAESIEELLGLVCERVARAAGARRGTIFLRHGIRLLARATRNSDGSYDSAAWARMLTEPAPPAVEAAVQSRRPVVARDSSSPLIPDSWAEAFEVSSALVVPLTREDQVIGALMLDHPAPERFSDEDVELAAAAAGRIASTIEQALESDERTLHLRAAVAIRRLLEEGASALSVREAGEVLARITRDALGSERATLLLLDEEERVSDAISVGEDGEFEEAIREFVKDAPARELRLWRLASRQPKPIFVENASASRLLPAELVERLRLRSYLAVPLLSAERPLGLVLCSHSSEPRRWSEEERQLVGQIALEGSLVVENAVLRAADQERLDRLAHQAFHDSLTSLPNRALFEDRLQHALDRMTRRPESIAVLFLDLDSFKPINDNFGHETGDRLLVAVGRRLQSCLRPEDTIARLGGDEFTVLLEDITDVRYAIRVAERIAESLNPPFALDGEEASVTASIGIVISTNRESSPEELLRNSDRAMYQAKESGKARYVVYNEGMPGNGRRPSVEAELEATEEALSAHRAEAPEKAEPVDEARVEEPPAEEEPVEAEVVEEELVQEEPAEEEPVAEEPVDEEPEQAPVEQEPVEESPPLSEPHAEDGEQPLPELSEARRRRRLRFPPAR